MLADNVMDAAFRRDAYQKLQECQALCVKESVENIEQKRVDEDTEVYSHLHTNV